MQGDLLAYALTMSRFALLSILSFALGTLPGPHASAAPVFEKWNALASVIGGAIGPHADERVPVWWDVTLDGAPDLLLCGVNQVHRVVIDESGALSVTALTLPPGSSVGRTFVALDVDGDGVEELLAVGQTASLFRVVAPDELGVVAVPLPTILARSVSDMAVGDLNRDGLPDIYVGVGRGGVERLNFSGQADFILMNRGEGRFERVDLAPRGGLTLGVVLADIDEDGRLDLVESIDTSTIAGPARLLWNRTEVGASTPVFEAADDTWDVGTHGMGLAIGDLNQDGLLDMYNTSSGQDLLVMGQGQGRFDDQTESRGILHQWASLGLRVQWSPSIIDLDLDGRLDLLVRHGLPATFTTTAQSAWAADLIYVQGPDGNFERSAVPSRAGDGEGKRFVVGDMDGDGRPDVGLDGLSTDVHYWHNITPVPDTTARLTVRFTSTVSPSPPVGVVVHGTCGALTHTRHLTSGGKVGGLAAAELHFAWPDCAPSAPVLTVEWPSGAASVHVVEAGVTLTQVNEPRWLTEGEDGVVSLDPDGTGALEACAMNDLAQWTCCESPCEVTTPPSGPRLVGLDERPPLGLPSRVTSWLLTTDPKLIVPGQPFELTVSQVGGDVLLSGAELSVDGVPVTWAATDTEHRTMSAEATAPSEGSMTATLSAGGAVVGQWDRPTGYVIDASAPFLDLYPVRPIDTAEEFGSFEVHVHSYATVLQLDDGAAWSLATPEGAPIAITSSFRESDMHRTSLFVDWKDLAGVDSLLLRDHPDGAPVVVPVYQPSSLTGLVDLIDHADCGLLRTRVAPTRETVAGVLTLFDAAGHPLLAPVDAVKLEVVGAQLIGRPRVNFGLKDLTFTLRVGDLEGDGHIAVRSPTGELWGTCSFKIATRPEQPVNVDASWATLSTTALDRGTYDKVRLRVGVVSPYGELLGADVWPTVTLDGGAWYSPLELSLGGSLVGDVVPLDDEDTIRVTVTLAGMLIESFAITVSGESMTDNGVGVTPEVPLDPEPGCGGAEAGPRGALGGLLLMALALFVWTRRSGGLKVVGTMHRGRGGAP